MEGRREDGPMGRIEGRMEGRKWTDERTKGKRERRRKGGTDKQTEGQRAKGMERGTGRNAGKSPDYV